ncbi:leucine zipper protein 1 [Bombina bombina]|uniref:leucine zipper protein 1 n=1 Tax=Bombina bombina TaxID=8345 RepID=UPI00235A5482|nr:leucine zipper protein 1 [Bombina bombina]
MEHSSRHLRFKLQSLGRRLDELEEATRNLQKAEDEVLDLQDKIIQAEGSNSSMLADVEALRKRVLKIEGKDEEIKKAEDMCRLLREKLENEENVTHELRSEIEQLQKRMTELEKLEEAFGKSKNDCTQLCLSLNEEKNMSKKLSSELEILRNRVKELETSESKLDKAEQLLTSELEKIRALTISFVNERKCFLEKEKQNEKLILALKEQLDLKGKMHTEDQTKNQSNLLGRSSNQHLNPDNLKIEDNLTSKYSQRIGLDFIKQSENQTSSRNENEKNKDQEDNKIKDLQQEIEKLKNQVKQCENVEEELKQLKEKNCELQDTVNEQNKTRQLTSEIEAFKKQSNQFKEVENGVLDSEELDLHSKVKNERGKYKGLSSEPSISKSTALELSPPLSRTERYRHQNSDSHSKRHLSNSSSGSRKYVRSNVLDSNLVSVKKSEDKHSVASHITGLKEFVPSHNENKKGKDQPSVLSRYPPAAQDQSIQKAWKGSASRKNDRFTKLFGEDYSIKTVENITKECISVEKDAKDSGVNLDIKVASLLEEVGSPENQLSTSNTEVAICSSEEATASDHIKTNSLEDQPKPTVKSEKNDIKDTTAQNHSFKYTHLSRSQDSTSQSLDTAQTTKLAHLDEIETVTQPGQESKRLGYNKDKTKLRSSSKPLIPEKPSLFETTSQKDVEKRNYNLFSKKQYSPKEKSKFKGDNKMSHLEDNLIVQNDGASEKPMKKSSDNSTIAETSSHIETKARPCSPREALQSTMIIKPVIIEKDVKEVMSSHRARSSPELSKSQTNSVPNKVMSSITIYPSESTYSISSIEETPKERHTSTSNIRLSANEHSLLTNNISVPFEISINKKDMSVRVADKDNCFENETFKVSNTSDVKEKKANNDFIEPIYWKSHDLTEGNHLDNKPAKSRSSWRRSVLGSTEELDLLTERKDTDVENRYRRKSYFDEDRPTRIHSREQHSSRRTSALTNSWTTPEFVSKRSQSSLTATEISRKSNIYESSLTSGLVSRYSHSLQEDPDDFLSYRRKQYSSEKSKSDYGGRKPSSRLELKQERHQKGMVEERIRQLQH